MADYTTERLIYSPEDEVSGDTTVIFGGEYYISGDHIITLPNTNMVDKGEIKFTKRQGVIPTIKVLNGSGHNISVQGIEVGQEMLYDVDAEIMFYWNDSLVRWEV